MKRKIINIGLAVSLLFSAGACKDFLDVNTDPNNPSTAPGELVFPAAVASTASGVGGDYAILGGLWSQYWTQNNGSNQYKTYDAFNLTSLSFNNRWTELYAGALNDYKFVKEDADAKANHNLFLMAEVMQSYTFQVLADLYDKIPFDEALMGEANLTPRFQGGEEVYAGLLARINAALARPTTATSLVGAQDVVFAGNMTRWREFANTLKLKMFLRQTEVNAGRAEAGVKALYAGGAAFLKTDAAMRGFVDQTGKRNPLFEQDQSAALNTNQNLKASTTAFNYLNAKNDPRLHAFYVSGAPTQKPLTQGAFNTPSTVIVPTTVSRARISATAPVYFISLPESYFLQAEAALRGWGSGDAKTLYEAGVRASYAQIAADIASDPDMSDAKGNKVALNKLLSNPTNGGNTDSTATAMLTSAYAFPTGGTFEQKLEAIIMQKWIALGATKQGIEAFFERNRTGYPTSGTAVNNNGQFTYPVEGVTNGKYARRLLIPEFEMTRNPNAPEAFKPITTPVWWDKNKINN